MRMTAAKLRTQTHSEMTDLGADGNW